MNPQLEQIKKSRPKAGTYKTFTSRKKNSHVNFQKPHYSGGEKGVNKVLMDEPVKLVVQLGIEFDAWTACLGSPDGSVKPSPYLHKLVTQGYKKDGKTVFLNPADLQAKLEAAKANPDTKIIYWEERDRSDQEKRLEAAIKEKEVVIESRDAQIGRLKGLLKGKVKDEDIESALKGA